MFKVKIKKIIDGFTLIEALIAISLLMIAISSPIMLAQKGLSSSILSRDQMIAAFLAQDGIEAIKNIRDFTAINQEKHEIISTVESTGDDDCNGIGRDCRKVIFEGNIYGCDTSLINYTAVCVDDINPEKDWLFDLDPCICNPEEGEICDLKNDSAKFCNLDSTELFDIDGQVLFERDSVLTIDTENPAGDGEIFRKYSIGDIMQTKFSRKINVEKLGDNEAKVRVLIMWNSPYGLQDLEINTFIYNYENNLF